MMKPTNDTMNQILKRQGEAGSAILKAAKRQVEVEEMKQQADEEINAMKSHAEASQRAEEAAIKRLQQGIPPVIFPTPDQRRAAIQRVRYNSDNFHFAVCGSSGTGKSSLVNALRGLADRHRDAAKVGVVKTTLKCNRYPDSRKNLPYSRLVWYDVPGAGTQNVPHWTYFTDQGLFVFDCLVLVYEACITEIDVSIIENCFHFKVQVIIVRSKADMHITNIVKSEDHIGPRDEGFKKSYQEKMKKFVSLTRSNFSLEIEKMKQRERQLDRCDSNYSIGSPVDVSFQVWLSKLRVYIVAAPQLCDLVKTDPKRPIDDNLTIDELRFFEDLLLAALLRRS